MPDDSPRAIFVSDFDGTFTRNDFYRLILDRHGATTRFWKQYRKGEISHFEALAATFHAAPLGEPALRDLIHHMDPDPRAANEVHRLQQQGWEIIIASAGCSWYIEPILRDSGLAELRVHANPGFLKGERLIMEPALDSPFYGLDAGIDKAAIVKDAQARAPIVAFAGDGISDVPPALLVPPRLRFARDTLAAELKRRSEPFIQFERWSEVTSFLIDLDLTHESA